MSRRGDVTRARARADEDNRADVQGPLPRALACGAPLVGERGKQGGTCSRLAGIGTAHPGWGRCGSHGGNGTYEAARGAWMYAHAMAAPLNVTPWQALLGEVRRTAGAVAFLDRKIAEAPDDDSLLQGGTHNEWLRLRQQERQHLARVSKMALDAGVAERMVAQYEMEGEMIAGLMMRVVGQLQLNDEQMDHARIIMRNELLALGNTQDGEVVGEEDQ